MKLRDALQDENVRKKAAAKVAATGGGGKAAKKPWWQQELDSAAADKKSSKAEDDVNAYRAEVGPALVARVIFSGTCIFVTRLEKAGD